MSIKGYFNESFYRKSTGTPIDHDSKRIIFKIKPEKVIYYPEELDVRSGWDLIQEFILQ